MASPEAQLNSLDRAIDQLDVYHHRKETAAWLATIAYLGAFGAFKSFTKGMQPEDFLDLSTGMAWLGALVGLFVFAQLERRFEAAFRRGELRRELQKRIPGYPSHRKKDGKVWDWVDRVMLVALGGAPLAAIVVVVVLSWPTAVVWWMPCAPFALWFIWQFRWAD